MIADQSVHLAIENIGAMDFMSESLTTGSRKFVFTIVETFSRTCPVLRGVRLISGLHVARVFDRLAENDGYPVRVIYRSVTGRLLMSHLNRKPLLLNAPENVEAYKPFLSR